MAPLQVVRHGGVPSGSGDVGVDELCFGFRSGFAGDAASLASHGGGGVGEQLVAGAVPAHAGVVEVDGVDDQRGLVVVLLAERVIGAVASGASPGGSGCP